MIDIIIPAYNAHNTIEHTLMSIAMQSIVSQCNVYIVDDCSDKTYDDIVRLYKNKMKLKLIRLDKNSGPGKARQVALDASDSPYFVFIDADDVFYNKYSLSILLKEIQDNQADTVHTSFIEETEDADTFFNHPNDDTWILAKIYSRKFMQDNDICFNDSRANEDAGFNMLWHFCGAKIVRKDVVTALWCYRSNSITRTQQSGKTIYELDGVKGYIDNLRWAIERTKEKASKIVIAEALVKSMRLLWLHYNRIIKIFEREQAELVIEWAREIITLHDNYLVHITPEQHFKFLMDEGEVNSYAIEELRKNGIFFIITYDNFLSNVRNK